MSLLKRCPRPRFSLAVLLGVMIPCAILAALYAREWQWHGFRARELAKLNSSLNPHYNGPDYQPDDGGASPPTGFLPWLLGEQYVGPVEKLKFVGGDHPFVYAMSEADGLVLKKGDEHLLDFRAFPELEELPLMANRNQFQVESAGALTRLCRFEYQGMDGLRSLYEVDTLLEKYVQALPRMPQLTKFDAANETRFLDSRYLPLLLEKSPQLTEFNLSLCRLGMPAIDALRQPQSWTESRLLLWEPNVDRYCDFAQAVLRQKQLTELELENYRYGSLHFEQENNEFKETPDYLAYRQFEADIPASQRQLELRDSPLKKLTINYVPQLLIDNNPALEKVKIKQQSGAVTVRDCPQLWFFEVNAKRVEIEGCPELKIVRVPNAQTIVLNNSAPIGSLDVYALEHLILSSESQGVELLQVNNFMDHAEATTPFELPVIPGLKSVKMHRLNAGLVASLAKQTGPLEIMLDLGPNTPHEDWGYDPGHFSEFWKRVKIGKLQLHFNCWELDLRKLFADFEQCRDLEELEIYGLHYLFSDPPNRKDSLDQITFEEAEKLWMLTLPPKLKKIRITRVLEYQPTAAMEQHPLVQFLKKKYPHIDVEFVPW